MSEKDALLQSTTPPVGADPNRLLDDAHFRGQPSVLKAKLENAASLVTSDKDMQHEIAQYAAAGLKTAALFVRGRFGLAASVGLFGADEVNPADVGSANMVADFGMGAAKGVANKYLFDKVGERAWNPAMKAMSLGIGSRLADGVFNGRTYVNESGDFAPLSGVKNAIGSAFDVKSLGTDAATFGMTYGMFKGADRLANGALSANRITSTAFIGGSYGLISGAHGELQHQLDAGTGIDFGKVAGRGLALGAVDAVAAIPGGIQSAARMRAPEYWGAQQLSEIRAAAKANGLWMLEMPKPVLGADGTPVVMVTNAVKNMESALTSASRMATRLGHPITMDWNEVRFRVEPGATSAQMHESYRVASNDPARAIEALRGKPALEPEVLMRSLVNKSNAANADWASYAMSSLRHPTEIESFARAYARFDPQNSLAKMRQADTVQPGTQAVWKQAADRVARTGAGEPNNGEQRLFEEIRSKQTS